MVKKGSHDGKKEAKKSTKKRYQKDLVLSSFASFVHQCFAFFFIVHFLPPFFSHHLALKKNHWRFLVSTRCLHQQFVECRRLTIRHRFHTTSTEFRHAKGHCLNPTDRHPTARLYQFDTKHGHLPTLSLTDNSDANDYAICQWRRCKWCCLSDPSCNCTSASPAETVSWNIGLSIEKKGQTFLLRSDDDKKRAR